MSSDPYKNSGLYECFANEESKESESKDKHFRIEVMISKLF